MSSHQVIKTGILEILKRRGPMKARDLNKRLHHEGHPEVSLHLVNSLLYGELTNYVERLADYSWRIRRTARQEDALPGAKPRDEYVELVKKAAGYLRAGHFNHCLETCRKASARWPTSSTPYYLSAKAYSRMGRPHKACENYEKALDCGCRLVTSDWLAYASASEKSAAWNTAAKCLEVLINETPSDKALFARYLHALRHSGQYRKILDLTSRVDISSDPVREILWYRAVALEKLDRKSEAFRVYEQIVRHFGDHDGARASLRALSAYGREKSGSPTERAAF